MLCCLRVSCSQVEYEYKCLLVFICQSAEGKQTLLLLPQAQLKTVRKHPLLEENKIKLKLIVAKRLQYFFVSINSRVAGHTVQLRADGVALYRVGGAQEPQSQG